MFLRFLFLVNSYMNLPVYPWSGFHSGTGAYRLTILHISDHIKTLIQYAIFKALGFKVFLAPIVFVLFETILSRSFCVHLHNLHKRIQTFQVRTYISVLAL